MLFFAPKFWSLFLKLFDGLPLSLPLSLSLLRFFVHSEANIQVEPYSVIDLNDNKKSVST